ncbi:hypothetical protein BGX30_007477, partial [Mortierella sp. GBA39]
SVRSVMVQADDHPANDLEGMRLGDDYFPGGTGGRRRGAVRGRDDRRSEPLAANLACDAAGDPQHDRDPADPADGQRAG